VAGRQWSKKDDRFLRQHAGKQIAKWIANKLQRTARAVRNYAKRHQVSLFVPEDGKARCGKRVGYAHNGNSRGFCRKRLNHLGACLSKTCRFCGATLTEVNTWRCFWINRVSLCRICANRESRKRRWRRGATPRNVQTPGKQHTFPCGCSGILPKYGKSNLFAVVTTNKNFVCRITRLFASGRWAKTRGYAPIDSTTPHSVIRKMMKQNCVLCGDPLVWALGSGKTPHLHHDHSTGEAFGFAHPRCNTTELQNRVLELKAECRRLQRRVVELEAQSLLQAA
jgi:hypothetical protein